MEFSRYSETGVSDRGRGHVYNGRRRRTFRRPRPVAVGTNILDIQHGTAGGVHGRTPSPGREHGVVFVVSGGRRVHFVRGHHVQQLQAVATAGDRHPSDDRGGQ